MRRDLGLWGVVRANAYDDPRTVAAAAVLEAGGVPAYVAPLVVVTAYHRLECWAIGDGDEGRTGHLAEDRLAAIAWPEHLRGPRSLGRGERVGNLLRTALRTAPPDGPAYLVLECGGSCGAVRQLKVEGYAVETCSHEGIQEWGIRRPKIVQDRLAKRDRDVRKSMEHQDVAAAPTAAPTAAPPGPGRTTVGRPADDGSAYPNPTPSGEREEGIGGAGGLRQALEEAAARTPSRPAARGGQASAVGSILRGVLPGGDRERPPAGVHSRAPGAGSGDGGGVRGAAARAILGAEPNVREQVSNGRDVTLRTGAYYLLRLGAVRPELRREWEGELGPDPAPGALLWKVDPHRVELLVVVLAGKWTSLQNPEAYVRSALATTWRDVLQAVEGAVEAERHRAALEASKRPAPPAMGGGA